MGATAKPDATFYLLTTRAWELLIGVFVAFHLSSEERWQPGRPAAECGGWIGLLLLACSVLAFDRDTPFPSLYALVPTIGTALVILFATPETTVGRVLGWRPVVGVGLISYSAYLWHQPLFAFARHRSLDHPGPVLLGSLTAVVLLLAYLSWKYVEAPFRDRSRVSPRQILAYGVACSGFFIVLGLAGTFTTGFMARYEGKDRFLATMDTHEARQGLENLTARLSMKPFDPADGRRKVLIIGDSFGKDLINALQAGGLLDGMQASFRPISSTCGNLFLSPVEFRKEISLHRWPACENEWIYHDDQLLKLMLAADEVWFASAWREWQTFYIQKSVSNAQALTRKPVKVFGTKNFGKVRVQVFLSMSEASRVNFKGLVSAAAIEINNRIRTALPSEVFVDIQQLICGADAGHCNLFTPEGDLITYDGGHLTRRGAAYLGRKLARAAGLQSLPEPRASFNGRT